MSRTLPSLQAFACWACTDMARIECLVSWFDAWTTLPAPMLATSPRPACPARRLRPAEEEIAAALEVERLSADKPIEMLSEDPDRFFGRTTQVLCGGGGVWAGEGGGGSVASRQPGRWQPKYRSAFTQLQRRLPANRPRLRPLWPPLLAPPAGAGGRGAERHARHPQHRAGALEGGPVSDASRAAGPPLPLRAGVACG